MIVVSIDYFVVKKAMVITVELKGRWPVGLIDGILFLKTNRIVFVTAVNFQAEFELKIIPNFINLQFSVFCNCNIF